MRETSGQITGDINGHRAGDHGRRHGDGRTPRGLVSIEIQQYLAFQEINLGESAVKPVGHIHCDTIAPDGSLRPSKCADVA